MAGEYGGILNIYKPEGMTSFAVVSRIRRLTGIKKVGHCGTLDPFAEGVLPVCIGRATAAVHYMDSYDKRYTVEMVFGTKTDTQDRTGTTTESNKPTEQDLAELRGSDFAKLRDAVQELTGIHEQLPPMYSAIKMNGRRLYEYARKGIEVARPTRKINVYSADLIQATADDGFYATVAIHCSKGSYIRTICSDLGDELLFGAYADSLVRSSCGPFTIDKSVTLEKITELLTGNTNDPMTVLQENNILLPVESALSHMAKVELTSEQTLNIIQGQEITFDRILPVGIPIQAFCNDGRFIGITRAREDCGQEKILKAERIFVDVADYR